MNKFRKLGFIKYNGGLQINTSLLSIVLHEEAKSSWGCVHFRLRSEPASGIQSINTTAFFIFT